MTWLNGLVTSDLTKQKAGEAQYGLIVEKKGRIQTDYFAVPSVDGESLVLAVPRGLRDGLIATLDHYLIMEDAELEPSDLAFFHVLGTVADREALFAKAAYAGSLDWLGLGGGAVLAGSPDALAGMTFLDEAAFEALRIERGVPRFGVEVDATLYPQEASLERMAVAFDKGCYLGQEVVYMLENRGHVKRKLVPLDVEGDAAPAPGAPVTTPDGAVVGDVKSAVVGPAGKPVAIAMVKWAQSKAGTELRADARPARVRASDRA